MDVSGVLNGRKQAHASTTSRASEDVDLQRALHELGPRPMAGRRLRGGIVPVRTSRQHDRGGQGAISHHAGAPASIGGQHSMVEHEIDPGARRQGGQLLEQFERLEESKGLGR